MKRVVLILVAVCLVVMAGCGSDSNNNGGNPGGSQPTISSITPNKVSRGQVHVEGTITGANLGGVVAVNLGEGITLEEFTSGGATLINIRFSVSQNAAAGTRNISVTTGGGTATSNGALTVDSNRAPSAKFTVSPSAGAKNTTFTFDATQSTDAEGSIASYKWDFGDNQKAQGRIATHKFNKGGSFQVTLTVTDKDNVPNSLTKGVEVANGLAPIARFTVSPESGDVDTLFSFSGTNSEDKDGSIVRYDWTFGDGARGTGATVQHRFNRDGTFSVVLEVTDNDGLQSALDKQVRVEKFNEQAAKDEMAQVVTVFFTRYSKLDTLDAEKIVEDWSTSPDCPGRDHEIDIIKKQQETIAKTNATIVGPLDIYIKPDHVNANVNVEAEFKWTNKDGTTGQARAEHDFAFVFEGGAWLICNFQLIKEPSLTIFP